MQNKKLLSVVLALVLVCTCITGMLILNVGAADRTAVPVEWKTDFATTLADVKAMSWDSTQYAEIIIPNGTEVEASEENDVLFGVETIFDSTGARLPITFKAAEAVEGETPATVKFTNVIGDVSCSNSYTFQGLNFYIADAASQINFYAGSGEVVLDTVVLSEDGTGTNVNFYADNFTAAAFDGWDTPTELITTSLTLKGVDYTWANVTKAVSNGTDEDTGEVIKGSEFDTQVNGVGWNAEEWLGTPGNVTAANTKVVLNIENSQLSGVHARSREAVTPIAELTLNVDGAETTIGWLTGVGNNNINDAGRIKDGQKTLPDFDFTVNINAGSITNRIMLFRGVGFNGDMTVNISGGTGGQIFTAWGDGNTDNDYCGYVGGIISVNYSGGDYTSLIGPGAGAHGYTDGVTVTDFDAVPNRVVISGGTLESYYGTQGVQTDIVTTVTNGEIGTFVGSWNTGGGGDKEYLSVQNNISGGTITTFYGTGGLTAGNPTNYHITFVQNNLSGGTITTFHGTGNNNTIGKVENNFYAQSTTTSSYVYGTFYAKNATVGPVLESVTTNAVRGAFPRGRFYAIGCGEHNCDVVVNNNLALENDVFVPSGKDESAKIARCFGAAAGAVLHGDFTWNLTGVSAHDGECRFGQNLEVDGNYTLKYTGKSAKASCGSNFDMGPALGCSGDLNVELENVAIAHASGKNYNARVAFDDVGGKLSFTMKNSSYTTEAIDSNGQNRLIISAVPQVGDVSVTYIGSTISGLSPHDFEVDGTFEVSVGGTNTFTDAAGTVTNYPYNGMRVSKLVNNLLDGTNFADGFMGTASATINEADKTYTGSPVGSWVTTDVEGVAVTTWAPGDVENNIYSGVVIGASEDNTGCFFGTGDQTIANVTTNMYGGKINSVVGASSALRSSLGCYYGNYGPVTDKVVNNIYSGTLGNNVYASNGDLECEIYTNIGNNLYAELYPEAEALSQPSTGRISLAGGRYFTTEAVAVDADGDGVQDTDADGNPVTETVTTYAFDAKTGNTGPVYVNVDGAKLAMVNVVYGNIVTPDENGDAINLTIKNATATTHFYFNLDDDSPINGNVNVAFDNFKLTANNRHYYGPSNVGGNLIYTVDGYDCGGSTFLSMGDVQGDLILNLKNASSATDLVTTIRTSQNGSSEYNENADTDISIGGDLKINAENVTFGENPSLSYRDIEGSSTTANVYGALIGKYVKCTFLNSSIQFTNRDPKGGIAINEFDSCTFGGLKSTTTVRLAMQAPSKYDKKVFVYGETVVGAEGTVTNLELGRQDNQNIYIGAKPDANYQPVETETSLTINAGSGIWGMCNEMNDDGSFKHLDKTANITIYDVTVNGTGIFAPIGDADEATGYQMPDGLVATLKLVGNIIVPNGENPTIYVNAAEKGASVSPAVGESWVDATYSDKAYIYATSADVLANISGVNQMGCTGYAAKNEAGLYIYGLPSLTLDTAAGTQVSISIEERIYLNLLIHKGNLETYLKNGTLNSNGKIALDVGATLGDIGGNDLEWTSIDAAYIAEAENIQMIDGVEYVKVRLGAVAADKFGEMITFAATDMDVLNLPIDETYTMFSLIAKGVSAVEADSSYTSEEKTALLELYAALHNYGASMVEDDDYVMKTENAPEVMDTANGVVTATRGDVSNIEFKSMALLMGDAIGIRFNGDLVVPGAEEAVKLVVTDANGDPVENPYFSVYTSENKVMVDTYISLDHVQDELTFEIQVEGETALTVKTSVKVYTEKAEALDGDKTLALAQLAQAVVNYKALQA